MPKTTKFKFTWNDTVSTAKVLVMVAIGVATPAIADAIAGIDFGEADPIVQAGVAVGLKVLDRLLRNTPA